MINSIYGKIIENLRKRINVRLVNNEKYFLKYTNESAHFAHKIFCKNCAASHKIKPVLMLNKPIYVRFTVLELSKWLMCDLHYNFTKTHFDAELLFTDTDSLTYEIKKRFLRIKRIQKSFHKKKIQRYSLKKILTDNPK